MKGISTVIATILMLVITIALAGTAIMYMRGTFTTQTQGIQVIDAYCSGSTVYAIVKNMGTLNVSSISCAQTLPSGDTCASNPISVSPPLQYLNSTTITVDTCSGTGTRGCVYRLLANTGGQTAEVNVMCA